MIAAVLLPSFFFLKFFCFTIKGLLVHLGLVVNRYYYYVIQPSKKETSWGHIQAMQT